MKKSYNLFYIAVITLSGTVLLSQCSPTETTEGQTPNEEVEDLSDMLDDAMEEEPDTIEVAVDSAKTTPSVVAAVAKQKPLSITITNLKSATAPVIFSVYQDEDTYLDPKAQLKTYRFVPKQKTLKIKLSDLKFGTYAIAFYQDLNNSKAIDKNGIGIPTEPYAFSNDIRPKLSAPSFEDCKFEYSKKKNSITVKMGK